MISVEDLFFQIVVGVAASVVGGVIGTYIYHKIFDKRQ